MSDDVFEPADPPVREYQVIATSRKGHGYEIEIVGVGATQTRQAQPDAVEEVAREYLSLMHDVPEDRFTIRVEYREE